MKTVCIECVLRPTSTLIAITQGSRNDQLPLLSDTHVQDPLVPAFDHLTCAQLELEWAVPVVTAHNINHNEKYIF